MKYPHCLMGALRSRITAKMAWPPTGFVQASIASSATSRQTAIAISAATVVRDSPRDRRPTVAGPEAAVAIVDAAPAARTGLVAAE